MVLRIVTLALVLSLLPTVLVIAQEAAEPDEELRRDFQQLEDETRPAEIRLQLVGKLIREGGPEALAGLRALLGAPATPPELKRIIALGALFDSRLSLLDEVIDAAVVDTKADDGDQSVLSAVRETVGETHAPTLVRQLASRAQDAESAVDRRKLVIELLGLTRGKSAVEPLIDLWARNEDVVGEAARMALLRILPVKFHGPDAAREFWEERKGETLEEILRDVARGAQNGDGPGTERKRYLEFARSVVNEVGVQTLIDLYLGCREVAEVREMGARRLVDYPYAGHEGDEAAVRTAAAHAVLDTLEVETDTGAVAALLDAVRILMPSARAAGEERVRSLIVVRLDSLPPTPRPGEDVRPPDPRLAAVRALGELRDPAAVENLTRRYDALGTKEKTLRLAILDAIEQSGNGTSGWVLDKLKTNDPDDGIVVRLIQLLKKYKDKPEADPRTFIPALVALLDDSARSSPVRQAAAFTIGSVGVPLGDEAAIDALAVIGLSSDDSSVRDIAASQLGRAKKVPGKVIELLRERLGEIETVARVRLSVGRSIMNLLAAEGVRYLAPHLGDAEFWADTVRAFLTSDLIAGGRAQDAAATVRALLASKLPARAAEAARLVLEAGDLKWEGAAIGGRAEVAFDLVIALVETGQPAEALSVLNDIREVVPHDPNAVEQNLMRSRLLRATGAPKEALAALEQIDKLPQKPGDIVPRTEIERARVLIQLGDAAQAKERVRPFIDHPDLGDEARAVLAEATKAAAAAAGATPPAPAFADHIEALDSADPTAKTAAIEALKAGGAAAVEPLLAWVTKKAPEAVPSALETIALITGKTVPYDPTALEADRTKALEALKAALAAE